MGERHQPSPALPLHPLPVGGLTSLALSEVHPSTFAPDLRAWRARAIALMALLEAHGALGHGVRADLERGEFVWIDPAGRVSARASCLSLATWSEDRGLLTMAWASPELRSSAIAPVEGLPRTRGGVDEEEAFRWSMVAAETSGLEFLYRLVQGDTSTFLALSLPTFESAAGPAPARAARPSRRESSGSDPRELRRAQLAVEVSVAFSSGGSSAPVAGVLADLAHLRSSLAGEASLEAICRRLGALGALLCERARSTYDGSDWVARLERSGRRLERLAESWASARERCLLRHRAQDGGAPLSASELDRALQHLEDEWRSFVAGQRG